MSVNKTTSYFPWLFQVLLQDLRVRWKALELSSAMPVKAGFTGMGFDGIAVAL